MADNSGTVLESAYAPVEVRPEPGGYLSEK